MAALTALLPVVLANNQTTSSIATNSQSTTAENNAPSSFIEFNGSDQYMMIPHHADFNITTTESFTVSCWVKRNVLEADTRFVVKRVKTMPPSNRDMNYGEMA